MAVRTMVRTVISTMYHVCPRVGTLPREKGSARTWYVPMRDGQVSRGSSASWRRVMYGKYPRLVMKMGVAKPTARRMMLRRC
jgi:hypothetical protein